GVSPWLPVAAYTALVGALLLAGIAWHGLRLDLTDYAILILAAWLLWLHLDRTNVHERADQAADDADRSARAYDAVREHHNDLLARFEALCGHLELKVNTDDVAADRAEQKPEPAHDDGFVRVGQYRVPKEPLRFPDEPVHHGATRYEPEPPPTEPQPVTDTTAAVAAHRHRRWDNDAAQLDTRVEDLEVAHSVALLEHRMWEWRRGVAA
ncbi:MAG: hypothetical protein M3P83_04280, partial [Actinomycetota bacterium]|nr:hypothetical protein [Actinomycetota bacterium]